MADSDLNTIIVEAYKRLSAVAYPAEDASLHTWDVRCICPTCTTRTVLAHLIGVDMGADCVYCGFHIFGAAIGAGVGTDVPADQKFAHPHCYEKQAGAALANVVVAAEKELWSGVPMQQVSDMLTGAVRRFRFGGIPTT